MAHPSTIPADFLNNLGSDLAFTIMALHSLKSGEPLQQEQIESIGRTRMEFSALAAAATLSGDDLLKGKYVEAPLRQGFCTIAAIGQPRLRNLSARNLERATQDLDEVLNALNKGSERELREENLSRSIKLCLAFLDQLNQLQTASLHRI